MGVEVEILNAKDITLKKLNPFDAVILGIRAFNVEESLAYKNKILWEYVSTGGNLLIQYNNSRRLKTKQLAPLSLNISRDRVSDESADVQIINPKHPILSHLIRLQLRILTVGYKKRGLYFPNQWDEQFIPVLQMNDTGESAKKGRCWLQIMAKEGSFSPNWLQEFPGLPFCSLT